MDERLTTADMNADPRSFKAADEAIQRSIVTVSAVGFDDGSAATVRTVLHLSGWRTFVVASSATGLPYVWVTGFLLQGLIIDQLSISTVENRLSGILLGLRFCESRQIDISARCATGLLSEAELSALGAFIRGNPRKPRVNTSYLYNSFIEFFIYCVHNIYPAKEVGLESFTRIAEKKTPRKIKIPQAVRIGLDAEQRALFLSVIVPGHVDNPFGSMAFRNFAVFRLAYDLGLRSGEILGIMPADVKLKGGYLHIVDRRHNPLDPRTRPATQKTGGRVLPLCTGLREILEQLLEERSSNTVLRRSPYLINNHEGQPLSARGLRKIYETLRRNVPELEDLINHRLRHDWNDRWNEMGPQTGLSAGARLRSQQDAMGWVPGSAMTQRYGASSLRTQSDALILKMQSETSERRKH